MGEKRRLDEVFKTVGLPPYTYVKPIYYGEVRADISQPGKHLLIEGPVWNRQDMCGFQGFPRAWMVAGHKFQLRELSRR